MTKKRAKINILIVFY